MGFSVVVGFLVIVQFEVMVEFGVCFWGVGLAFSMNLCQILKLAKPLNVQVELVL